MLYGIDISNWQAGLDVRKVAPNIDFLIAKATEGIGYVDKCCDGFIQDAMKCDLLWGFYHFARNNDPAKEANYFYENCKNYFGKGIPVLDIESESIPDWGHWAQVFVDKVHAITGVYPIVYTSAAYLQRFRDTTIPRNCGLWVAGYPTNDNVGFKPEKTLPYGIDPWDIVAMWQFSSRGVVDGYKNLLDVDYAYMDGTAWMKYAKGDGVPADETVDIPVPKKVHRFEDDNFIVDITEK